MEIMNLNQKYKYIDYCACIDGLDYCLITMVKYIVIKRNVMLLTYTYLIVRGIESI